MINLRPIPYIQQQHPFVKITLIDDHTWSMGLVGLPVIRSDTPPFIDELLRHDSTKTYGHHSINNDCNN